MSKNKNIEEKDELDLFDFLNTNDNLDLLDFFDSNLDEDFATLKGDNDLPEKLPLIEKLKTKAERDRDNEITELLKLYRESCQNKTNFTVKTKGKILLFLSLFLIAILIGVIIIICVAICNCEELLSLIVSLVGSFATMITSVFASFNIIMKYVFNDKEDENITKIVDVILTNDLKNKEINVNFIKGEIEKKDNKKD